MCICAHVRHCHENDFRGELTLVDVSVLLESVAVVATNFLFNSVISSLLISTVSFIGKEKGQQYSLDLHPKSRSQNITQKKQTNKQTNKQANKRTL